MRAIRRDYLVFSFLCAIPMMTFDYFNMNVPKRNMYILFCTSVAERTHYPNDNTKVEVVFNVVLPYQ